MARHPIMNYREQRELRVPDLMGGLNTRDSLSMVNDNQLTDSLNVWWHDGVLKTRPGLLDKGMGIGVVAYDEEISPKQTDVYIGAYRLCYCSISGARQSETFEGTTETFAETVFWLQGSERTISLPTLNNCYNVNFVCQKGKTVYAFVRGEVNKIFKNDIYFKGGELEAGAWTEVAEDEMYVPTVATYCYCDGSIAMKPEEVLASGAAFEGYNLLGSYYKLSYNAYNPKIDTLVDDNGNKLGHVMLYGLLENTAQDKYKGMTVTATYTNSSGATYVHEVTILGRDTQTVTEASSPGDGLVMRVFAQMVIFLKEGTTTAAFITKDNSRENNLEFKAPYVIDETEKAKAFNMTQCTWFGGDAAGISGGSRLFLCGNTSEDEKALVLWSGLNNPLYFSENCYAYVGNENQAVTCFGKQGEALVIFKESGAGSYYTQYVKADSITASDLINQSVVDYAASSVYFPIITLHPTIGCDCPDTVQLCRNRLVWACSDGNVYTLASQNQYSERNVYCVSEMISRKLKTESDLQNAFSADWEGHYLLFTKNRVYVMDYESYGYAYIASHTKTENAQTKIPWWYWELPKNVCMVTALGVQLFVVYYTDNGLTNVLVIEELSADAKDDTGDAIKSMLQTKLFDFSLPAYKKNVRLVNLSLGNNGSVPIKVEFITEHGTEEQEIVLESGETEIRKAGYIRNKAVYPCIKAVKRFGVRLHCEGEMAADGISFNYMILGGVR